VSACWAVIPVKSLEIAKSRLAPGLSAGDRISLSLEMLERVLSAVAAEDRVSPLVISRDPRALDLAREKRTEVLEDRWEELNPSLEAASRWCRTRGASCILVLHADLPMVRAEDIAAMIDLGRSAPSVVLAPCRRREGTNALFMQPAGLIPYAFGPGSFKAHQELASRQAASLQVYYSPSIALDIDTMDDLELFRAELAGIKETNQAGSAGVSPAPRHTGWKPALPGSVFSSPVAGRNHS